MTKKIVNIGQSVNDKTGDTLRSAFDKINQNFTELYNATGGGLDLLNVASHIVPATDITYDLGSSTKRFRHLYVGPGSIYIDNARLSLVGGKIQSSVGFALTDTELDAALPSQTGNAGKFLTTDGTHTLSWAVASGGTTDYNNLTNKPTLFSGSYTDLTSKPTIPAAQIQSDWNVTDNTLKSYIANKPTIPTSFSSLVNGGSTVSLASTGILTLPNSSTISPVAQAGYTYGPYSTDIYGGTLGAGVVGITYINTGVSAHATLFNDPVASASTITGTIAANGDFTPGTPTTGTFARFTLIVINGVRIGSLENRDDANPSAGLRIGQPGDVYSGPTVTSGTRIDGWRGRQTVTPKTTTYIKWADGSSTQITGSRVRFPNESYAGIVTDDDVSAKSFPATIYTANYSTAKTAIRVNGKQWGFGTDGSLTVPQPTSTPFTLTFAATNYVATGEKPTLTLAGNPWELHGQYVYASDGRSSLMLDDPFPILTNPGYDTGDSFTFGPDIHGIVGYTLTITLTNVVQAGPAGWTANVTESAAPAYPSTILTSGAIKLTTNNNSNWIFGTDGKITFPGATGFQATFGDVPPIGDVLHSINDLVLKSDHSVTIVSGEGIDALETSYNDQLADLTSLLSAELYGTSFLPARHDSIIELARAKALNPLISDQIITVAQAVSNAWDAWQEALSQSAVTIGVGNLGWYFNSDGSIGLPSLNNQGYQPGYSLNGPTLKLGNPNQQVIITGPTPTVGNQNAQRIVIQGQKGYGGDNVTGEGGDVYIWAGVGGESTGDTQTPGDGGDVKVRGGAGQYGGNGGYVRIEAGDSLYGPNGSGGFIDITAGNAANNNGYQYGGSINIRAGTGSDLGEDGQINLYAGGNSWYFTNTGKLQLPVGGDIVASDGTTSVLGGGGASTGNIRFDNTWIKNVDTGNIYISPQDGFTYLDLPSDTQASAGNKVTLTNEAATGGVRIRAGQQSKYWDFNYDGSITFPDNTIKPVAAAAITIETTALQPIGGALAFDRTSNGYLALDVPITVAGQSWTLEAWIYPTDTGYNTLFGSAGNVGINVYFSGGNIVTVQAGYGSAWNWTVSYTANTWMHLAVSYHFGSMNVWVNGQQGAEGTNTQVVQTWGTNAFTIGGSGWNSAFNGNGMKLTQLRLVTGVPVYDPNSTTITVPTSQLTVFDPQNSRTKLLLLANTSGTAFVDAAALATVTPHSVTWVSASPQTTPVVNDWHFGTDGKLSVNSNSSLVLETSQQTRGSAEFSNSKLSYISVAPDASLALGTNDFTIEWWQYQTARGPFDSPFGYFTTGHSFYFPIGQGQYLLYISSYGGPAGDTVNISGGTLPSLNAWHHYAVVRQGTTFTLYVDGASVGTSTSTLDLGTPTDPITVGSSGGSDGATMTGYMTNFRIINGTALYTANFTPSTTPLEPTVFTKLLLLTDSASGLTQDSTGIQTVTNANGVIWNSRSPFAPVITTHDWAFGADGSLTLPANSYITSQAGAVVLGAPVDGAAIVSNSSGTNQIFVQGDGSYIQTGVGQTSYTWAFGTDGNLTLPADADSKIGVPNNTAGGTGGYIKFYGAGGEGDNSNTSATSGDIDIVAGVDGGYEIDNSVSGDLGNIRLKTKSYTGQSENVWKFSHDGHVTIPGSINGPETTGINSATRADGSDSILTLAPRAAGLYVENYPTDLGTSSYSSIATNIEDINHPKFTIENKRHSDGNIVLWTFDDGGVFRLGSSTGAIYANQTTGRISIGDALGPDGAPAAPSTVVHIGGNDSVFAISDYSSGSWTFRRDHSLYTSTDLVLRSGTAGYTIEFTGYIDNGTGTGAGATLHVTAVTRGTITSGMTIYGSGLPVEGWTLTFGTVPNPGSGGTGNYNLAGANFQTTSSTYSNGVELTTNRKWTLGTDGTTTFPSNTISNPNSLLIKSGVDTAQVGSAMTIATNSSGGDGLSVPGVVDVPYDNTIIPTFYYTGGGAPVFTDSTITFANGDVRTITSIITRSGPYLDIAWSGAAFSGGTAFPITVKTGNYAAATTAPVWTLGTNGRLTLPGSIIGTVTQNVFNTTSTTVNAFGAATTLNIGAAGGTTTIAGDLTVNGTTTTINSTTVSVDDKNIELGSVATPTNTTADGGGITLKGATDKTIVWDNANSNWTSSEHWNIASGKSYKINNVAVLTASAVLNDASQTSVTIAGNATTLAVGNTATAAQTVSLFTASTGASTYNFATGATANATTKTINIGGGGVLGSTTNIVLGSINSVSGALGTITHYGNTVLSSGSLTFSGDMSRSAWTTSGIRHVSVSAVLTDTTSTGTVANAYTNNFGGNTIAASNAVTFTNYATVFLNDPAAGTNVTFTNAYSLITAGNVKLGSTGTGTIAAVAATATTSSTASSLGYLGLPQSATAAVSNNTTLVIGDSGKHIYVNTASQTMTIPANGTVAYPIGTTLTFIAGPSATTVSIAITTDTMYLAGTGTTGTRTLAAHGMATAVKVAATTWYINGTGLT